MKYDAIVIGSGPGGNSAAYGLKAAGKSVAVIESELWGGTCPNYGCDPKKILMSAVEAKSSVTRLINHGFDNAPKIIWEDLMAHKRDYTEAIPESRTTAFKENDIAFYEGQASFVNDHEIMVDGETLAAEQFLIATGQRPRIFSVEGQEFVQSSRDFLDLDHLPGKIAFIGAGYVSLELASIANASGAEVHVIHHNQQPLKEFDHDLVQALVTQLTAEGVHFHFDLDITEIKNIQPQYQLLADDFSLVVDYVVGATGRVPNVEALQLEKAGVKYSKAGILVDGQLRTNVKNIFACGDVIARKQPKLTPVSVFEANFVVEAMKGSHETISYPLIPTVVYGSQRLAQIGLSQKELAENPDAYHSQVIDLTSWYTYRRINEENAQVKVVYDQAGKIVNLTVLASLADELINYCLLLMEKQVSHEALTRYIFAYPTPASDLEYLV